MERLQYLTQERHAPSNGPGQVHLEEQGDLLVVHGGEGVLDKGEHQHQQCHLGLSYQVDQLDCLLHHF